MTEALGAAVGNRPAEPKPETAKDAANFLSHSMPETLIDAVRSLRVTEPDLGVKLLVNKLRVQHPGLVVGTKEVREVIRALEAETESESKPAEAVAALPVVDKAGAPSDVSPSL